MKRLLIEETLL